MSQYFVQSSITVIYGFLPSKVCYLSMNILNMISVNEHTQYDKHLNTPSVQGKLVPIFILHATSDTFSTTVSYNAGMSSVMWSVLFVDASCHLQLL